MSRQDKASKVQLYFTSSKNQIIKLFEQQSRNPLNNTTQKVIVMNTEQLKNSKVDDLKSVMRNADTTKNNNEINSNLNAFNAL